MSKITSLSSQIITGALLIAALSIPALVAHYSPTLPFYWNTPLLLDIASWTLGVLLISALLKFKNFGYSNLALVALLLSYLAIGTGIASTLTIIYFIISSYLLGRLALLLVSTETLTLALFDRALLIGICLYVCVFSLLIHFPVNHQVIYLAILGIPFLFLKKKDARSLLLSALRDTASTPLATLQQMSFRTVVALVLFIGYVSRFSFFPSIGFDDNVLHLRMWTELTQYHFYSFDIEHQIWSVAPFAIDLLHSIISLASNSDARGALNIAMLGLLLRAVWMISSSFLDKHLDKTLLLLLLCSTPILSTLLTSLQTELLLALLITMGVKVLLEESTGDACSRSLSILSAASLCAATKLPGMVLGFTLLIAYAPLFLREKIHFKADKRHHQRTLYILFILILSFTAVQSYIYSWFASGNPLFPLYNEIFKSPYFDIRNFSDPLYQKGFSLKSFWSIFYNTSTYYESKNFVAGFQYLYLLPIGIITLIASTKINTQLKLILITPTLGFGLVMFSASQYWRYLFPIVPLASVIVGFLLYRPRSVSDGSTNATWVIRSIFMFFIAANIFFFPGITWFFSHPTQLSYTAQGKATITDIVAPSKSLTTYLSNDAKNPTVLYDPNATLGATLLGKPIYTNWYSPKQRDEYDRIKTKADIVTLIERNHVEYVVWDSTLSVTLTNRNAMLDFLTLHGQPIYQVGPLIAYKISTDEVRYKPLFDMRTQAPNATPTHSLMADTTPKVIATISISNARSAKYDVTFECSDSSGSFIAQINWDVPPVYYKLIPCMKGRVNFTETLPIPQGTTNGNIYITARDRESVDVIDLNIGLN
ncbi:hypothetical protein [Pseudomonas sp. PGPR40]|uniref:hypothetical protein n=1 Tax=Pseudomonas sp. PGPR40 TaxID=2913476 RepID=UPI001EDA7C8F|nr:hypothetical protein [Pseudomonas sp. PGPR40]